MAANTRPADERINWVTSIPFIAIHLLAIATPFWVGVSWQWVALAVGLYYLRMFGITAGYHRYFSHRAFKTSRVFQFVLAVLGSISSQKGVLWWSAHHRWHHKYSDQPEDIHSPRKGFFWSHMGWIMVPKYQETHYDRIQDFAKYPELVWLNKYWAVPPVAFAGLLFLIGGLPWVLWGFVVSTAVLWHGTFTINSLTHIWGRRRYVTTDDSKNSFFFALITMGEGWHNNHHYYQSTANQGFFWWEIDLSYYILKGLSLFGIVWDLRTPPKHILEGNRVKDAEKAPRKNPLDVELVPPAEELAA